MEEYHFKAVIIGLVTLKKDLLINVKSTMYSLYYLLILR